MITRSDRPHLFVTFIATALFCLWLGVTPVHAEDIGTQDFNDLTAGNFTQDALSSGRQLTNIGSYNSGGPGLDFATYWIDTRAITTGPFASNESSGDYIGVNSYADDNAPDVSPVASLSMRPPKKNFEFNDGDGRLDLVFEPVDLNGYIDRHITLNYWIADTGFESPDGFYLTISDGSQNATYLNYDETDLNANTSADDGTANWKTTTVNLDDLINNQGFGEVLTLTISVDTDSGSENLFIDNVAFTGIAADRPSTSVDKSVTPKIAMPDEVVTYTILLANKGLVDDRVVRC